MIIKTTTQQKNDIYRPGTVVSVLYDELSKIEKNKYIEIDHVYDLLGVKQSVVSVRMAISKISRDTDMKFSSRMINDVLHVWRV